MRCRPTRVAMLGVLVGLSTELACTGGVFACREGADCRSGSTVGTCEPSGWCSFPDPECVSGQRYGGLAGAGLANTCVEPDHADATTAGSPETASSSSSDAGMPGSDDTQATTAVGSGSGDEGPSSCGDGVLGTDEPCDDGNDIVGDGCNPGCVQGGEPVWSVTVDGRSGGFDGAFTIESYVDGDLAVGVALAQGDRSVPGVWRIDDDDGALRWSWSFGDQVSWATAYTWGLDIAKDSREGEAVVVTATGTGSDGSENALARVRGDGEADWYTVSGGTGFGVAVDPSGELWTGGYDAFGNGMIRHYGSDGVLIDTVVGEPSSPATGFPYELLHDGGARLLAAGIHHTEEFGSAYLRVVDGADSVQADVTLGVYNEGLGIAYDPLAELDWVVGYVELADNAEAVGQGWIGAFRDGEPVVEPRVVTEAAHANLHGVAIDPSGAIVAVGWQSPEVDRDPTVVKVAPDGEMLWTRTYPGVGNGELRDVVVAADGSIFVAGQLTGADGTDEGWIARLAP